MNAALFTTAVAFKARKGGVAVRAFAGLSSQSSQSQSRSSQSRDHFRLALDKTGRVT